MLAFSFSSYSVWAPSLLDGCTANTQGEWGVSLLFSSLEMRSKTCPEVCLLIGDSKPSKLTMKSNHHTTETDYWRYSVTVMES